MRSRGATAVFETIPATPLTNGREQIGEQIPISVWFICTVTIFSFEEVLSMNLNECSLMFTV